MKENEYRGLTKEGKWVCGDYVHSGDALHYIVPKNAIFTLTHKGLLLSDIYSVDPETIGQFTGLFDKNGKEIYKGDRIRCNVGTSDSPRHVTRIVEAGCPCHVFPSGQLYCDDIVQAEVIGNIHEDLLEESE